MWMRLNLLPFVLAPGLGGIGYLVGGGTGVAVALGGWAAVVSAATLIVISRHVFEHGRRAGDTG